MNTKWYQQLLLWWVGSDFFPIASLNKTFFRCFAYQNIYEGFLVSQSGEAVCSLYTAKEGDRTMTLKRGQFVFVVVVVVIVIVVVLLTTAFKRGQWIVVVFNDIVVVAGIVVVVLFLLV